MYWGGLRITHRALAGLLAAAALTVPAQAGAATAWKTGDTIVVASGWEDSDLSVSREASDIVVADSWGSVSAASGCTKAKAKKAKCPVDGADRIVAVLGGGGDTLDAGSATLAVSAWGGDGDDTLLVRNGFDDYVSCGDGADSGLADAGDSLASDCESTLERPIGAQTALAPAPAAAPSLEPAPSPGPDAAPVGGETAGQADDADDAPAAPAAPPVAIQTPRTIAISKRGVLPVGVACTAGEGVCAGTIEIVEQGGVIKARSVVQAAGRRKATKKKAATVLGRAKFSVRAGAEKRVSVRLSRRGRRRVIRRKKRKTRAKIVISMRAPDGTVTTTEKNVSITFKRGRRR